jgi:hypothetical protein
LVALVSLKPHRPRRSLPHASAAVLLALVLTGCSELALSTEDAPAGGGGSVDPGANAVVANRVKAVFKDGAAYQAFELAGLRWVHTLKGWNWLACVRFQDHGHQRFYAVFVKDGAVTDDRYAVETDGCQTQSYVPLDQGPATVRPVGFGIQQPIY